nr:hypothetical protein [Halomonas elongata]
MTLKERLKQLKAGADHQAAELGHDNAAGAAVAFGRVTGRALGNVVHDAGKLVLAFVPEDEGQDTPAGRASDPHRYLDERAHVVGHDPHRYISR